MLSKMKYMNDGSRIEVASIGREGISRMVTPMIAAFKAGRSEAGVADFIHYVYNNPHKWASMSASSRKQTMENAHEWEVMMTNGTLFPTMIDNELTRLLPSYQNIVVRNAGHQMWYQAPELCQDVEGGTDASQIFAGSRAPGGVKNFYVSSSFRACRNRNHITNAAVAGAFSTTDRISLTA